MPLASAYTHAAIKKKQKREKKKQRTTTTAAMADSNKVHGDGDAR